MNGEKAQTQTMVCGRALLFLRLKPTRVSWAPRLLRACFRSSVKREKTIPIMQATLGGSTFSPLKIVHTDTGKTFHYKNCLKQLCQQHFNPENYGQLPNQTS